jgi:hypothetical protein
VPGSEESRPCSPAAARDQKDLDALQREEPERPAVAPMSDAEGDAAREAGDLPTRAAARAPAAAAPAAAAPAAVQKQNEAPVKPAISIITTITPTAPAPPTADAPAPAPPPPPALAPRRLLRHMAVPIAPPRPKCSVDMRGLRFDGRGLLPSTSALSVG